MSSFNLFQISKENMADAGLPVSLLTENYAWVDERLEELYYSYAITVENFDELNQAGLIKDPCTGIKFLLEALNEPLAEEISILDQELSEEESSEEMRIMEQWVSKMRIIEQEMEISDQEMLIDELIDDGPLLSLLDLE